MPLADFLGLLAAWRAQVLLSATHVTGGWQRRTGATVNSST
jgi:hypothetical protein